MNKCKELREERGKTQKEVFEETGIPIRSIQNWENGKRQINPESAKQLADYFEVNLAYIYGYSKIQNEDYIVDLQNLIHREYELKLEKAKLEKDLKEALDRNLDLEQENGFLRKENQEMTEDLYNIDVVVNDFKERNHIDS